MQQGIRTGIPIWSRQVAVGEVARHLALGLGEAKKAARPSHAPEGARASQKLQLGRLEKAGELNLYTKNGVQQGTILGPLLK